MRASLALAAAILLAATTAGAQTASPAAAPSAPTAPKPAAGGVTVSGVTVTPSVPKPCGSRDKDCIATVVAELKTRYPEELKRFCFQRAMRSVRTQLLNDQIVGALHGEDPATQPAFGVNAALQTACSTRKK
jgi:hypothetical protein